MSVAEAFLLGLFAGALCMWPLVVVLGRIVRRPPLRPVKRDPGRDWYDPKEFRR